MTDGEVRPGSLRWVFASPAGQRGTVGAIAIAIGLTVAAGALTQDGGLIALTAFYGTPTAIVLWVAYVAVARVTPDRGWVVWAGSVAAAYGVGVLVELVHHEFVDPIGTPRGKFSWHLAHALVWPGLKSWSTAIDVLDATIGL